MRGAVASCSSVNALTLGSVSTTKCVRSGSVLGASGPPDSNDWTPRCGPWERLVYSSWRSRQGNAGEDGVEVVDDDDDDGDK